MVTEKQFESYVKRYRQLKADRIKKEAAYQKAQIRLKQATADSNKKSLELEKAIERYTDFMMKMENLGIRRQLKMR